MTPYWTSPDGRHVIYCGNCIEVMATLDAESVDAIVCDPPYGLSFMGKKWDYDVPSEDIWRECLRVLKPGGHLLAFAGTRTQHRMTVRIEDAGFEIRDMIAWVYGSGFPKSLDVSKAIDKAAGAEREVVGYKPGGDFRNALDDGRDKEKRQAWIDQAKNSPITAPATDAAKQWDGWGTALKPAMEPITVARKPLCGTVAANVLEHGTGAINVDGCRVGTEQTVTTRNGDSGGNGAYGRDERVFERVNPPGRWPANLIHDGSDEVVGLFPNSKDGVAVRHRSGGKNCHSDQAKPPMGDMGYGGGGSAARFFYCAKASKRDRDEGCGGMEERKVSTMSGSTIKSEGRTADKNGGPKRNHHPTVKPTDLMRYLCRLVTPPGGIVLDPFVGSGSTGKAAILEGFQFIGIELSREYCDIAVERMKRELSQPMLPGLEPEKCEIAAQRLSQEVLAL